MTGKVLSDAELLKLVDEAFDECYEILFNDDDEWKEEKKNDNGDVVVSRKSKKGKKIYRVTAVIDIDAKKLSDRLSKMEGVTEWNKTLLKYQLLRRLNNKVTISYQVTMGGGPGEIVSSREFVLVSKEEYKGKVFVQAGCSVENYPDAPKHPKAVRAENGPTGIVVKPLANGKCEFRWLMDCEYKGWIPNSILEIALPHAQLQFVDSVRKLAATL